MKKIIAFLIVVLLLLSTGIPVFADLGESDFDNWNVRCGPAGFSFDDRDYDYDTEKVTIYHDYIEPGIKLWVHSFDTSEKKYLLVISDENHKVKGNGFVYVTEQELNKYFVGEKKTVTDSYATKLKKKVECVVTPRVGVVFRQGPSKDYPAYRVIPQGTKLTYQSVIKYDTTETGGKMWAYTTYRGQTGWFCCDYTEKVTPKAETTTTAATTHEPAETTTAATAPSEATGTEPVVEKTTAPAATTEDTPEIEQFSGEADNNFFSNTKMVIAVICCGAVILALTATVLLMLLKRKKG